MTRNNDELEFQENFEEKEEITSISCERADADQSEGNNCSQEEIESFIKEQKSENTVRKTARDMKTFNRYLSSINKNIQVLDLPAADLDRILSKFFKLMSVKSMAKNMNLTRYQAFSEAYIQRFLSDGKSHFNVLIDKEFETSRKVLTAKRKSLLQKAGKGNRRNATRSLTDDEDKLFKSGQFGASCPEVLQRTMWWFLSLHFGFRARDESRKLIWGDVQLQQDPVQDCREVLVCTRNSLKYFSLCVDAWPLTLLRVNGQLTINT